MNQRLGKIAAAIALSAGVAVGSDVKPASACECGAPHDPPPPAAVEPLGVAPMNISNVAKAYLSRLHP